MSTNVYDYGGKATIESYKSIDNLTKAKHIEFFEKLRYFYMENNSLFVHAGFTSEYGPEKEFYKSTLIWDRTLWEMAVAIDKTISIDSAFFPKRLKLFNEIFVGHTPTSRYDVFETMNVLNRIWNIDTGAGLQGSLTILNVTTKEFFQSDRVYTLYPAELGRVH